MMNTITKIKSQVLLLLAVTFIIASCGEEKDPAPTFAEPTISVTVPEGGLTPEVGTTVNVSIALGAEAGLSGLYLNNTNIKSFAGTETSATVTHEQLIANENPITLNFEVEDAQGVKVSAAAVTLNPVPGEDLGYLLVDFAGESSGNEVKTVVSWDVRTVWTMAVSGEIGTSVTLENVGGEGFVSKFAAANPDPNETSKVLKYSKASGPTSLGTWGGWNNLIIGLKNYVPASEIEALPTYDSTSNSLVAGTKVVALDVYYDATVDQDFTWNDLLAFENGNPDAIWNSDASKGLKIGLTLSKYSVFGVAEVGYDKAWYISYDAYVTEPNKWVTVKFNLLDEGYAARFYDNRDEANTAEAVPANEVDCFTLRVSPGYDAVSGGDAVDTNPIYFKNLRIIDAE